MLRAKDFGDGCPQGFRAVQLGALGYVVKAHAESELLAAVEAVRQGRQFVSKGLAGHVLGELDEVQAPNRLRRDEVCASQTGAKD